MNLNEINIEKAKQEFPAIASKLEGALSAWKKNVGTYIINIVRETNPEKLKQWFRYCRNSLYVYKT